MLLAGMLLAGMLLAGMLLGARLVIPLATPRWFRLRIGPLASVPAHISSGGRLE
jgi:hypothetical protein